MNPQANVLSKIYDLVVTNKTDDAMDMLYDVMDELLSARSFPICERMLENIDIGRLNTDLLIGALSITLPAKRFLSTRGEFLLRVEHHLANDHRPDELADLLRGLR